MAIGLVFEFVALVELGSELLVFVGIPSLVCVGVTVDATPSILDDVGSDTPRKALFGGETDLESDDKKADRCVLTRSA